MIASYDVGRAVRAAVENRTRLTCGVGIGGTKERAGTGPGTTQRRARPDRATTPHPEAAPPV
jgi:hypothetical protein